MKVWIREHPSDAELAIVEAADPSNPFAAAKYARARESLGATVVLFGTGSGERFSGGVLGYLQGRAAGRWLEIPSTQLDGDADEFWRQVLEFSRRRRVIRVEVSSFGARTVSLPQWDVPKVEKARTEWRLALADASPASFATNHRRNIAKAKKAGVTLAISSLPDAAQAHAALMGASMDRRQGRGEDVPVVSDAERRTAAAFLSAGAANAYQAVLAGNVVSSFLVLRAADGAYYHSAGTSPEGMEIGASTFLLSEIIRDLKDAELSVFNFGGAGAESPGLVRFKQGFGAVPVELRAGEYTLASALERRVRKAVSLLREPAALARAIVAVDQMVVFSAPPAAVERELAADLRLEKLDDKQLEEIARDPELSEHHERALRVGYNTAYGLWRGRDLLHVAWLIEHAEDSRATNRNVKLRQGEAEITHCQTPQRVRGQGAYPIAIGALAAIARERGVKRLFMITNLRNIASQRGITKAGLRPAGRIWRISFRYDRAVVTIRGHRWPSPR